MSTAEFVHTDGTIRYSEITIEEGGDWPSPLLDGDGIEWVLAQRPGISENVQRINQDGTLEPAPTCAVYYQSVGVDATCLTCSTRDRYASHTTADYALKPHRKRQHDTLIIPVHLDDANIIPHLNRTVGDIRDNTELREGPAHHLWDRVYRWALKRQLRNRPT